eukprot:3116955-Prymnesium_polylepis.1
MSTLPSSASRSSLRRLVEVVRVRRGRTFVTSRSGIIATNLRPEATMLDAATVCGEEAQIGVCARRRLTRRAAGLTRALRACERTVILRRARGLPTRDPPAHPFFLDKRGAGRRVLSQELTS